MMRSSLDRPGVGLKPLCRYRCFAKIVPCIRVRDIMWAIALAGTDRSDIPRYLSPEIDGYYKNEYIMWPKNRNVSFGYILHRSVCDM